VFIRVHLWFHFFVELLTDRIESPIGDILLAAVDGKLIALEFAQVRERFDADLRARFGDCALKNARNPFGFSARVRAYFRGDIEALDGIPVDGGGTAFQRKVWAALRDIPAGATKSYSDLARAVGRPNAVRAVGMINGRNPISIVVPCHRVIGKDGSLTGYGGGLDRKRWLLQHEGALLV
jgi:methylated-DNA-[protein]-cysteine S-methyltransferase